MTAADVIARLSELGATVALVGGVPRVTGYPPEMGPAARRLMPDLAAHRAAILAHFGLSAPPPDPGPPDPCPVCGRLVWADDRPALAGPLLCDRGLGCPERTRKASGSVWQPARDRCPYYVPPQVPEEDAPCSPDS